MTADRPVAAGTAAFLDDLATVFASWLAAAPRAWAVLALAVVAASAWLDRDWLPDTAVIAGCVVAGALPWRVPAAAALVGALLAVLTFASDTLRPEDRDVLAVAAPAVAAAVVAAWAVGREDVRFPWVAVTAQGLVLGALVVARGLGEERNPVWGAAVAASAAAVVPASGSSIRWAACALFAGTVAVAQTESWALAPFGLLEGAGAALLVTIVGGAARRGLGPAPVNGDSASARCATAVRRRPLAAAVIGVGLSWPAEPFGGWVHDAFSGAFERIVFDTRVGALPPQLPWPAGWFMVPFLAAHIAALDGLASAVRRASVTAAVAAGASTLWAFLWEVESGFASGGIGRAWIHDQLLEAAVVGIVLIVLAVYSSGTSGKQPAPTLGGADILAIALAAATPVARLWIEAEGHLQVLAPEILLGIAAHRLAMAHVPVRAVLRGTAATTLIVTVAATLRSTRPDWLLAVAVLTAASLGRIVLWVLVLRRIRSLTPVPDDHPILADYGTDLRARPAAVPA